MNTRLLCSHFLLWQLFQFHGEQAAILTTAAFGEEVFARNGLFHTAALMRQATNPESAFAKTPLGKQIATARQSDRTLDMQIAEVVAFVPSLSLRMERLKQLVQSGNTAQLTKDQVELRRLMTAFSTVSVLITPELLMRLLRPQAPSADTPAQQTSIAKPAVVANPPSNVLSSTATPAQKRALVLIQELAREGLPNRALALTTALAEKAANYEEFVALKALIEGSVVFGPVMRETKTAAQVTSIERWHQYWEVLKTTPSPSQWQGGRDGPTRATNIFNSLKEQGVNPVGLARLIELVRGEPIDLERLKKGDVAYRDQLYSDENKLWQAPLHTGSTKGYGDAAAANNRLSAIGQNNTQLTQLFSAARKGASPDPASITQAKDHPGHLKNHFNYRLEDVAVAAAISPGANMSDLTVQMARSRGAEGLLKNYGLTRFPRMLQVDSVVAAQSANGRAVLVGNRIEVNSKEDAKAWILLAEYVVDTARLLEYSPDQTLSTPTQVGAVLGTIDVELGLKHRMSELMKQLEKKAGKPISLPDLIRLYAMKNGTEALAIDSFNIKTMIEFTKKLLGNADYLNEVLNSEEDISKYSTFCPINPPITSSAYFYG
jgi:hypothetical protein